MILYSLPKRPDNRQRVSSMSAMVGTTIAMCWYFPQAIIASIIRLLPKLVGALENDVVAVEQVPIDVCLYAMKNEVIGEVIRPVELIGDRIGCAQPLGAQGTETAPVRGQRPSSTTPSRSEGRAMLQRACKTRSCTRSRSLPTAAPSARRIGNAFS